MYLKSTLRQLLIILIVFSGTLSLSAQDEKLRINLNESGDQYIRAAFSGQFWARYTEMNAGTVIDDDPIASAFDFSIRRMRMGIFSQLSPRLYVYFLLGNNNLNQKTESGFMIDILDYYAEYKISDALEIGMGESAWGGQSRWNVASTTSLMSLDAPLFALATINKNDDLGRTLGVWAKGHVGKVDYVLAVKEPLTFGVAPQEGVTDYVLGREHLRYSAYFKYEFLDNEGNKSAFSKSTYLGKKNIFNLGAGYVYQKEMTASLMNGLEESYDYRSWTVELFYDRALNTSTVTALTSYLGYFNTDLGANYIRNVGANNFTSGGDSFNGAGNAFPMIGTGETILFQLGYLTKQKTTALYVTQIQPYFMIQHSNYDRLNQAVVTYDMGLNYYMNGHASKISLGLQNRPVFQENTISELLVTDRKNMIVLQYQVIVK